MSDPVALKEAVARAIDELRPALEEAAKAIHAEPELAFEERRAAERLCGLLAADGVVAERPFGGLATAFRAELRGGRGPVVVLCAEYDALPEIGHACGHNLMGVASAGAFLGLKRAGVSCPGTVRLLGTPAEERGNGKARLLEVGAFRDADAAMMFHAGSVDELDPLMLAMAALDVEFDGRASHAAAKPHLGVNALDAMIMSFNNIAALRQVIRADSRVHGIITEGGDAPNIIPAHTAAKFLVRSPDNRYLDQLKSRALRCFEGAAAATGAALRHRWTDQVDSLTTNGPIGEAFARNAAAFGRSVGPRRLGETHGSTDMGSVSSVVPSIHPFLSIAPAGTPTHSIDFARHASTPAAYTTMTLAAKALAWTVVDLLVDPDLVGRAKQQHRAGPS